jgi:uncharacterized protein YbjT (DUF2867 family)
VDVLLFGATGMVGRGVLRECLLAPDVTRVVTVGRSATGARDAKLRELVTADLYDLAPLAPELTGFDACFFCLGVSSVGMSEAAYTRVTYDLTLAVATTLARLNPGMTFVYVTGAGTDSTERGRSMWARVKGRTENALRRLPLTTFLFRPGLIQPLHGIRPKSAVYRAGYAVLAPVVPPVRRAVPRSVTTTEQVGRAMLAVARHGHPTPVLESADINAAR